MEADPSAIDVGSLSQVLGATGGWFVAVLLFFGGGGWMIWSMATDRLVVGRRLRELNKAYAREKERGDVLARTLLELQPGVKVAVHTVEQFRSLTINGDPPTKRQGIDG